MPYRRAQTIALIRAMSALAPVRRARKRKIRPQEQPTGIEQDYYSTLITVLNEAWAVMQRRVFVNLPNWLESVKGARTDGARFDSPEEIRKAIRAAVREFDDNFRAQEERLAVIARNVANQTSEFNRRELMKQAADALGFPLPVNDQGLLTQINEFTQYNISLIGSIGTQYHSQVESEIMEAVRTGQRHEDLAKDLSERYNVSESRAALIARDQVLKFHGALNQTRQRNLGLESYIWRTVGDNHVRPEHYDRNTKPFKWADPPEGGHPGEDYQCRCYPEPDFSPILDSL